MSVAIHAHAPMFHYPLLSQQHPQPQPQPQPQLQHHPEEPEEHFTVPQVTSSGSSIYSTQNELLLHNLLRFYEEGDNLDSMLRIINGESPISLRIIDWFATNYAKKYYTVYNLQGNPRKRFKVYLDYKLMLKAYSKKRFDPFCRWERISVPYKDGQFIQTTIGQLNFFKWALENEVILYISNPENYDNIEKDMVQRNTTSRKKSLENDHGHVADVSECKTRRKRREELSVSATKSIKMEQVQVIVSFD